MIVVDPVPYPEDKLSLANRTDGVLGGLELARLEEEPGAPVAANFEVFHQLHCLVNKMSNMVASAAKMNSELYSSIYLARLVLPSPRSCQDPARQ